MRTMLVMVTMIMSMIMAMTWVLEGLKRWRSKGGTSIHCGIDCCGPAQSTVRAPRTHSDHSGRCTGFCARDESRPNKGRDWDPG